jgi:Cdc6-like AAA superfamily ATPase
MEKLTPEQRSNWDRHAVQLTVRAEELGSATDAFADTVFLDVLKTHHNQIIFGRRGTGKTHLLKRLEEEFLQTFETTRVVPAFINGSMLKQKALVTYEAPETNALSLYTEFIKALALRIHKFINTRIPVSLLDRMVGGEGKAAKRARAIAQTLSELLEKGDVRFFPTGVVSEEVQNLKQATGKVAGGASLNLSDPRKLGWKLDVEAAGSAEVKRSGVETKTVKGEVILPFGEVSSKISELLNLIDGATLVVLFDEWSDIDKDLATQPFFADMIKQTLSSITRMHVKLACIPVRTRLSTPVTAEKPIPFGYELGDDITVAVDLDKVVFVENDLAQFVAFYLVLLKRHMGLKLGWVKEMDPKVFEEVVCSQIFENTGTFSELCQASAGVPRDFLQLFLDTTKEQLSKKSPKIQIIHIRDAAGSLYEEKKTSFGAGSLEITVLDQIYRGIIAKHKTYYFLLTQAQSDLAVVRTLWSERVIHKMPAGHYDDSTNIKYVYHQMDYGNCIDLMGKDAAAAGEARFRQMAGLIEGYRPQGWLSGAFTDLVATISGRLSKRDALAKAPAGNVCPNPRNIIVSDELLTALPSPPPKKKTAVPQKPNSAKK